MPSDNRRGAAFVEAMPFATHGDVSRRNLFRIAPKEDLLTQPNEYNGPSFVAHDEAGNDYMLVPVYRCRVDSGGDQLGQGYAVDDLVRLWTATGEVVRRDAAGSYRILHNDPRREVILTSKHPKAV